MIELRVRLYNRTDDAADLPVVGQRRRRGARRLPVVLPHRRARRGRPRQARGDHLPGRRPAATTGSTTRRASRPPPDSARGAGRPARLVPQHPGADLLHVRSARADDFFGGYDHRAAGRLRALGRPPATRRARSSGPGATTPFGHAWDRNLTDGDGPYIELMAGVYTDNQPDFSFLAPGETKTFTQYWYPVAGTGVVVASTLDAALGRPARRGRRPTLVARRDPAAWVRRGSRSPTADRDDPVRRRARPGPRPARPDEPARPADPVTRELVGRRGPTAAPLGSDRRGDRGRRAAARASSRLPPAEIASVEELYLIGRHLEQYRHATRSPEPYWPEALTPRPGPRRDPHRARRPALPRGAASPRPSSTPRSAVDAADPAQPEPGGRGRRTTCWA